MLELTDKDTAVVARSSIFHRIIAFKASKDYVITSCLPCVFRPLKRRIPFAKVVLRPEYKNADLNPL